MEKIKKQPIVPELVKNRLKLQFPGILGVVFVFIYFVAHFQVLSLISLPVSFICKLTHPRKSSNKFIISSLKLPIMVKQKRMSISESQKPDKKVQQKMQQNLQDLRRFIKIYIKTK